MNQCGIKIKCMNPKGKVFVYQEIKHFYSINIVFLHFYSLTHCLPRQWQNISANKLTSKNVKQTVLERILKIASFCL